MFNWIQKLFRSDPVVLLRDTLGGDSTATRVIVDNIEFRRVFRERVPFGSMTASTNGIPLYDYFCPRCDSRLVEGPRGGWSVNAACSKCRINYGCLPDYWGD